MSANNEAIPQKTAEEVRNLLVQKRTSLNLTQKQIGEKIGCCDTIISFVETGHRSIAQKQVDEFAKAYHLPVETLQPLVSPSKLGGHILDFDVLPLIKKIAASKRETLTVAELDTLIKGYCALQKNLENITPELRDLLLNTFAATKTD